MIGQTFTCLTAILVQLEALLTGHLTQHPLTAYLTGGATTAVMTAEFTLVGTASRHTGISTYTHSIPTGSGAHQVSGLWWEYWCDTLLATGPVTALE